MTSKLNAADSSDKTQSIDGGILEPHSNASNFNDHLFEHTLTNYITYNIYNNNFPSSSVDPTLLYRQPPPMSVASCVVGSLDSSTLKTSGSVDNLHGCVKLDHNSLCMRKWKLASLPPTHVKRRCTLPSSTRPRVFTSYTTN